MRGNPASREVLHFGQADGIIFGNILYLFNLTDVIVIEKTSGIFRILWAESVISQIALKRTGREKVSQS
jgi:hypothetical protein